VVRSVVQMKNMWYVKKKKKAKPLPLFEKAGVKVTKKVDYVSQLDRVFSRYIRLRDAFSDGTFMCISCGKIKPLEQADCGHYHSRRHMNTRYDEENCHAQCRHCNRMLYGNMVAYSDRLKNKIGQLRFDILALKAVQTKQWTDWELKELIKHYKLKCEELEKQKGIKL